ncbi:MAG TPA: hypothetical protein VKG25_08780 [Bryobacteraceae bacterium]|nr:hypothetical protein [Bryobacteraceae bacterium]
MTYLRCLALATLLAGLSGSLYAVDGVVLIDQNRALAGGVTPGDTPGFPVTISQAGSYRLTGNLTLPDANTDAIDITADDVMIDLNGFTILGPVVCTGQPVTACSPKGNGNGISNQTGNANITVVNGVVRGMGGGAIILSGGGSLIEKVTANSSGGVGILTFLGATIIDSNGSNNLLDGINTGQGSLISGNVVRNNGASGIETVCPTNIVGNAAYGNKTSLNTALTGCGNFNNVFP